MDLAFHLACKMTSSPPLQFWRDQQVSVVDIMDAAILAFFVEFMVDEDGPFFHLLC